MAAGVIYLAAGSGSRFGSARRKQYVSFLKAPLFLHALRRFLRVPGIADVVIAAPLGQSEPMRRVLKTHKISSRCRVVEGGRFRGESVSRALAAFKVVPSVVLIHDAARPLVTKKIIQDVLRAAQRDGVALAAWPLADTLKLRAGGPWVKKTIPRDGLWLAQTPQAFRRDAAMACLKNPVPSATDDVSLAERRGFRVRLVKASPTNMKVTYKSDLKIAAALVNL